MHKSLVVAPEHQVDIVTPELILCGFIECLHTGDTMETFGGITASAPYTKKKDVSPVDWFEDVQLAHSVCNTHFLQE
jgi:hypothetical protein